MQNQSEAFTLFDRGWIVRIQPPKTEGSHRVMLLLHGFTGDERVMWVFTRNLPQDYWLLALRAPHPAPQGGYSWVADRPGSAREFDAFAAVVPGLIASVQAWLKERGAPLQPLHLMGFSQGAALCYTLLLTQPDLIGKTAALAGMLPNGAEKHAPPGSLDGKSVLITHGIQDSIVPVSMARVAASVLHEAGADVTYCEDDSGHKLGPGCHKSLGSFFA